VAAVDRGPVATARITRPIDLFKWKKDGGSLPRDTVERVSHLLAIHKALEICYPTLALPMVGFAGPMPSSTGKVPLMSCAAPVMDIYRVRQYVDAQRGG
jgi:hypothetical protein